MLKQVGHQGESGAPEAEEGGGGEAAGEAEEGRGGGRPLVVIEEDKVSGPQGGGGEDTGPVCGEKLETSGRQIHPNEDAF